MFKAGFRPVGLLIKPWHRFKAEFNIEEKTYAQKKTVLQMAILVLVDFSAVSQQGSIVPRHAKISRLKCDTVARGTLAFLADAKLS